MPDLEREKLMDRIMKMYRKAQSLMEMGNEAEALSFMEGVQKTLQAHNLEMSEVEYQVHQKEQPIKMHTVNVGRDGKKKRRNRLVPWQRLIITVCAEAHFCKVIYIADRNDFFLIGRREDRMVGEFMILTLLHFAETAADKAYVKAFYEMRREGNVELARGFRKSFITAFTLRLVQRYEKLIEDMERQGKAAVPGSSLIRLSTQLAMVRKVAEEINKEMGTEQRETRVRPKDLNIMGAAAGLAAANAVNLKSTGLDSGQGTKPVGPGQKMLEAGNAK